MENALMRAALMSRSTEINQRISKESLRKYAVT
jgi:hypothetical protein